jgi:hypothetical protein
MARMKTVVAVSVSGNSIVESHVSRVERLVPCKTCGALTSQVMLQYGKHVTVRSKAGKAYWIIAFRGGCQKCCSMEVRNSTSGISIVGARRPTPTSPISITPPDPGLYQARYHHQTLIYGPGHASIRDNRRLPLIFEPEKEGAATAKMLSLAHVFKGQRVLD